MEPEKLTSIPKEGQTIDPDALMWLETLLAPEDKLVGYAAYADVYDGGTMDVGDMKCSVQTFGDRYCIFVFKKERKLDLPLLISGRESIRKKIGIDWLDEEGNHENEI